MVHLPQFASRCNNTPKQRGTSGHKLRRRLGASGRVPILWEGIRRVLRFLYRCCLIAMSLLAAGCFQPPQSGPGDTSSSINGTASSSLDGANAAGGANAAELDAHAILRRLLAAYRDANSYSDRGIVRLEFEQSGQSMGNQWPCSVQFARPNRLALQAFQATVRSDGKQLVATIDDPPSQNLDGQAIVRPAPKALELTDLASDPLLYDLISSQLGRQPIQLELLLDSGGLAAAFGPEVAAQRLSDERTDGRDCYRVELPTPGGPFVFWIDRESFVLRRLDYPAASLFPGLAGDPTVKNLRLSAELVGASLDGMFDEQAFAAIVPENAKRMKSFVVPPQPLPSPLFGETVGDFFFTDLAGGRVDRSELAGKIAILTWYHGDATCAATLEQVAAARAKLANDEQFRFLAVATDPTSSSNAALERTLAEWKADLPIVRDLEAFGRSVFGIENHPTVIVLDGESRLQIFQVGGSPALSEQLVEIASRLAKGTNLAAEIRAQHDRDREQYEALVARGGPEPGEVIALPPVAIRARSEPANLRLTPLWTSRAIPSPGNFLLVKESGPSPTIFVVEGTRNVVEISPDGKIAARHTLTIPAEAAITYLRTVVDAAGKRFYLAAAPLAPQFFVFDAEWKLVHTIPTAGEAPLALTDLALFSAAEGAEPLVLAANVGELGLIAYRLDGTVAWRNRKFPNVTSVAVSSGADGGEPAILLTGPEANILRVDSAGTSASPTMLASGPAGMLVAGTTSGPQGLLAITATSDQTLQAVGLRPDLTDAWRMALPPGVHVRPIQPITSSRALRLNSESPDSGGEWWLAGPDGSIHFVSGDGRFRDRFDYGASLTGIAATQIDGRAVLLVATEQEVAALEVALPTSSRER
jgi:hypothetical protein